MIIELINQLNKYLNIKQYYILKPSVRIKFIEFYSFQPFLKEEEQIYE